MNSRVKLYLSACSLVILILVAWVGTLDTSLAMSSKGSVTTKTPTTSDKQVPLTEDQLWMLSSGAISASGYTVKPIPNPNTGAVGYVVPDRPSNPQ